MWIGIPTTPTSQLRSIPHFPSLAASASTPKSNPPSISSSSSNQVNLKSLGHAVLNLTTSHKSILITDDSVVDGGGQLSGSDILLAIQQADLRKKNKKKTKSKKVSSLAGQSDSDDDGGGVEETSGVTPLMIKSDWGKRIEDLERRLRDISEI